MPMNHNLTTHQSNVRVWSPDAFGSIAFLIASELAFAEVCHRWICFRNRTLAWKIVAPRPPFPSLVTIYRSLVPGAIAMLVDCRL